MKKIIAALLLVIAIPALANLPIGPMNYQGRLLDSAGVPLGYPTPTTANFVVRIFNNSSAGTLKYEEIKNGIAVDDGVYSFKIGTGPKTGGDSAWDIALWQGNMNNLFMELEVNGEIMLPRTELTSAPHAFTSTLALSAQSLGNITVTDFDNILQNICASSNGKWLELANGGTGTCLGTGTSFPGPMMVSISSLTASTDFTYLDLSRADISGIHFENVDLSHAIFKDTRYQIMGLSNANLSYTRWDGAIETSFMGNWGVSGPIIGASFKNMDMSRWMLNQPYAAMSGVSAAYLTGCPAFGGSMMYSYVCRSMQVSGAPYFVAGPNMDFSTTSVVATSRFGEVVLDVDPTAFDNIDVSMASFQGVTVTQNFSNSYLFNTNLSYAHLKNIVFTNTTFNGTNFKGSRWDNVMVASGMQPMAGVDFQSAELNQVRFDNVVKTPDFSRASLKQVDFVGNLGSPNFTNATLEDVRISYLHKAVAGICPPDCSGGGGNIIFSNTRVYGSLRIIDLADNSVDWQNPWDISFLGARVTGDFGGAFFASTALFRDAIFSHLDLCGAVMLGLAEPSAPHSALATVLWDGPVECPNGDDVIGGPVGSSDTCDFSTRMVTPPSGGCTPGVP